MIVLHVIANLSQGGAEAVLTRLIVATSSEIEHVVVSLRGDAYYGRILRSAGVEVHTLNMPRGRIKIGGVITLRKIIKNIAPDVVQTWMYHADLVGGLVARWVGVRTVVWGIRNSTLDADKSSLSSRLVARVCAALSKRVPAAIVCCSEYAAKVHQGIGYCKEKFVIIPNGYDLSIFDIDDYARTRLRREWCVADDETLLGLVARWDPQKDHANLLSALSQLKARQINFRCVLVGSGINGENATLVKLISDFQLNKSVILAGPRDDIPVVMNALDLHILPSSYGEAFPNVVAEAMACGTPCVVTNVGDASSIVGEAGWVVSPKDPEALARVIEVAISSITSKGRGVKEQSCRQRIKEKFSLIKMQEKYSALWEKVSALRGKI